MTMGKTIRLVEDSAEAVELTRYAFSECARGVQVVVASDGQEALDWLTGTGKYEGRNADERPDLVLLDLKLPKVSGFEVLERMRNDKRTRVVPVVMLTVSRLKSDIERAYGLGANSYLVKPLEFEKYSELVFRLCDCWLYMNERPYP